MKNRRLVAIAIFEVFEEKERIIFNKKYGNYLSKMNLSSIEEIKAEILKIVWSLKKYYYVIWVDRNDLLMAQTVIRFKEIKKFNAYILGIGDSIIKFEVLKESESYFFVKHQEGNSYNEILNKEEVIKFKQNEKSK